MEPLAPQARALGHPTAPPPHTMPGKYRSYECWGNTPQRLPVLRHRAWCHPNVMPPISGSACMTRCCAQGTASRAPCPGYLCGMQCPGHPSSTGAMLRPRQGAPVPRASGCREARASRRKPRSRRELAQPEGLGVCRARCVLGSPGSTYPVPVPTQRGAGRPAGARASSVCTLPWFSPPRAAGTARDTGGCGGVRLGLRHQQSCPRPGITYSSRDHDPRGWTEPSAGAGPTHQELSSF